MSANQINNDANVKAFYESIDRFIPAPEKTPGVGSTLELELEAMMDMVQNMGELAKSEQILSTSIEKLTQDKVDELSAISDAMGRATGDNPPKIPDINALKDAWKKAGHNDWADKYAEECGGKSLADMSNVYNTRSTDWDNKISVVQGLFKVVDSRIQDENQSITQTTQLMQSLQNIMPAN